MRRGARVGWVTLSSVVALALLGAWWSEGVWRSEGEAQACCRTCPTSERDPRGCCPARFCEARAPAREASKRPAARERPACRPGEHRSAGHCCALGAEWVPGRGECVCLDPGGCGARRASPATPTPAAGPASAGGGSCPEGMVSIPGGTFEMGSPFGGDDDERPVTRVTLSGFCMDRTEVTVRAYASCVSAGACRASDSVHWEGIGEEERRELSARCNFRHADRGEHPVNCVDWAQAEAYCRWRGARLPTEAEWEYGARGTDGRTYPWGNDAPTDARLQWSGGCGRAGCRGGTSAVGAHPSGASAFGLEDMAGNVWEWTADWYGPYRGGSLSSPRGPDQGRYRVIRGGGWHAVDPSRVRAANRDWDEPALRYGNLGFRCARGGS